MEELIKNGDDKELYDRKVYSPNVNKYLLIPSDQYHAVRNMNEFMALFENAQTIDYDKYSHRKNDLALEYAEMHKYHHPMESSDYERAFKDGWDYAINELFKTHRY